MSLFVGTGEQLRAVDVLHAVGDDLVELLEAGLCGGLRLRLLPAGEPLQDHQLNYPRG